MIELDLHRFYLGILGQDLCQYLRPVIEREAEVPDFTRCPPPIRSPVGCFLSEPVPQKTKRGLLVLEIKKT